MKPLLMKPSTWITVTAAALGLVAGLFLRDSVPGGVHWCRDVDYGSLPQYLALLLALIFGLVAARGVKIANDSFKHSREVFAEDVRLRTYAQARLVYAEVVEIQNFRAGVSFHQSITDRKVEIVNFPSSSGEIPWHFTVEEGVNSAYLHATPEVNGRSVLIRIHNTSEELISRVAVAAVDVNYEIGGPAVDVLLAPRSSIEWFIATDGFPFFTPNEVTVTFTDAMGEKWVRRGGQPVEPFPPEAAPVPTKFNDPAKSLDRRERGR